VNRPLGVPALAGPDRLKAGLQTSGVPRIGSWSQCMREAKGVCHDPTWRSNGSLPWESGAEDARTPSASRLPGVSEPREASGVRPIYRRFPSGGESAREAAGLPFTTADSPG